MDPDTQKTEMKANKQVEQQFIKTKEFKIYLQYDYAVVSMLLTLTPTLVLSLLI
jgi:hypothetical protein